MEKNYTDFFPEISVFRKKYIYKKKKLLSGKYKIPSSEKFIFWGKHKIFFLWFENQFFQAGEKDFLFENGFFLEETFSLNGKRFFS